MSALLLSLAALLPLLLIPALAAGRGRGGALVLAPWSALPALALALFVPAGTTLAWPALLFGVRLGLDDIGRAFLLFSAPLWLLAGIYARAYLAQDARLARFMMFHLATMSGSLGAIIAQDVVSFYFFFALMTFAAYGMVIHTGTPQARRAARVYLVLAVIGEALLFAGLLLAVAAASHELDLSAVRRALATAANRDTIAGLVLAGFGVKAGVLFLHVWLPLAHPVAPTPASAILSGVLIKAGLLGWIRFLPVGEAALPNWGEACMALGLAGAFYAATIGVLQREPKTLLAYSSVSQMGLMTALFGIGLAVPTAWPLTLPALLVFALHHGFAKAALFLGVGLSGAAGRVRTLVLLLLALPALALAGAPFTSGAAAKFLFLESARYAPGRWAETIAVALPLSSVATATLMSRFLFLIARARPVRVPAALWSSWLAALLLAVVIIWWLLPPEAQPAGAYALSLKGAWEALWPVGAGLALLLATHRGLRTHAVPAGDVLAWARSTALRLRRRWRKRRLLRGSVMGARRRRARAARIPRQLVAALRTRKNEKRLRAWQTVGASFLLLAAALFVLLAR